MKKFIVLYHASDEAIEKMKQVSPEDHSKGMEAWMTWAKKCGDGLVDLGSPLGNGQKITKSGESPSDKNVAGYSVLQAEDMESAKAMLQNHPHLFTDACEIEVHEALPMPE